MASDPLARFKHLSAPPVDGSTSEASLVEVLSQTGGRPSFWPSDSTSYEWSDDTDDD